MKKTECFYLLLITLFLATCGLEDYPFINPVQESGIVRSSNNNARVPISNDNDANNFFSHYTIFYRIYVSNVRSFVTTPEIFSTINGTLDSDYSYYFLPVISSTTPGGDMHNLFSSRGYKYLCLEGNEIKNVLTSSVFDHILEFDFPSNSRPVLRIKDNNNITISTYTLWRSDGDRTFSPRPNRYFVHSTDLIKSSNLNDNTNADVTDLTAYSGPPERYTYAAFFIVAVGIDGFSNFYSNPTLIHVFQLPDEENISQ